MDERTPERLLAELADGFGDGKPNGHVFIELVAKRPAAVIPTRSTDDFKRDTKRLERVVEEESASVSVKDLKNFRIERVTGANYFYEPPSASLLERGIRAGATILLVGPPGSGKSSLLKYLARRALGVDSLSVSLNGETTTDDFFGGKELREVGTIVQTVDRYGPITRYMKNKRPVIVNEIDAAPAEILFGLHQVLERTEVVLPSFEGEDGEPLVLHPWAPRKKAGKVIPSKFCFMATANTLGYGDDSGLYRGTKPMNAALLDRFDIVEVFDYPPAGEEVKVLVERTGIKKKTAEKIVQVANLARAAFKQGQRITTPFSVRRTLGWATLVANLGIRLDDAFASSVLKRAPFDDREALNQFFSTVFARKARPEPATVTEIKDP